MCHHSPRGNRERHRQQRDERVREASEDDSKDSPRQRVREYFGAYGLDLEGWA